MSRITRSPDTRPAVSPMTDPPNILASLVSKEDIGTEFRADYATGWG